jgi:hypothetical protein
MSPTKVIKKDLGIVINPTQVIKKGSQQSQKFTLNKKKKHFSSIMYPFQGIKKDFSWLKEPVERKKRDKVPYVYIVTSVNKKEILSSSSHLLHTLHCVVFISNSCPKL